MARRDSERALALEFVGAVAIRTLYGFREQHALLGPQNYAAMMVAYGMLSVLVLSETTDELAAVLGGLLLLAILLRPTGGGRLLGVDTAKSLAAFTGNVADNPVSTSTGARPRPTAPTADIVPVSPNPYAATPDPLGVPSEGWL